MNAIWRQKREAVAAGLLPIRGRVGRLDAPPSPPQQRPARPPRTKQPAARRAQADPLPECVHRGDSLGKLICNCSNKPYVYGCALLTYCIGKPLSQITDGKIVFADGNKSPTTYLPWDSETDRGDLGPDLPRMPVCSLCERRQAAESPTASAAEPAAEPRWKPPEAAAATVAARQAICGACPVADVCGFPTAFLWSKLVQCPDGRWGAES